MKKLEITTRYGKVSETDEFHQQLKDMEREKVVASLAWHLCTSQPLS